MEIITSKLIWSQLNIFNSTNQRNLTQDVRNFYGEKYGFHFLFKRYLLLWLLFPIFLGIILEVIEVYKDDFDIMARIFPNFIVRYMDLLYFTFCFFITNWAIFFMKFWKGREIMYSYFWGLEGAYSREKFRDEFKEDGEEKIILDYLNPYQSQVKKWLKIIISYLVTILIMLFGFWIMKVFFAWEKDKIKTLKVIQQNPKAFSIFYPIITSLLNSIQMELFNYVYVYYFAVYMTKWENHEKISLYENSMILKEVTYKTVNGFSSIFFIAFLKKSQNCENENCFNEIGIQVYTHFFVFFIVRILIYFKRMGFYWWNRVGIENKVKNVNFKTHSINKLQALEDIDYLLISYNDLLILFGEVIICFVAAPLTPLFFFIILYIYKLVDNHSMFHYANTNRISEVKGIQIYYKIFYIYCFFGVLGSISFVVFTNPIFFDTSLVNKFITLAVFENVAILIMYFFNFKFLPKWFENIDIIKSLYNSIYYSRDKDALPHHDLTSKISNRIMMSSIANHIRDDMHFNIDIINIKKDENKQMINDKDLSNISLIN